MVRRLPFRHGNSVLRTNAPTREALSRAASALRGEEPEPVEAGERELTAAEKRRFPKRKPPPRREGKPPVYVPADVDRLAGNGPGEREDDETVGRSPTYFPQATNAPRVRKPILDPEEEDESE